MSELSVAAQRSWAVPGQIAKLADWAGVHLTSGIPAFTWNGMSTAETTLVKNGELQTMHLLFPGMHPAGAGEAELRFAWSPRRRELWNQLNAKLPALKDAGFTHLVGGGSYFHSDKVSPSDIDVLAIVPGAEPDALPRGQRAAWAISDPVEGSGIHIVPISDQPTRGNSPAMLARKGKISAVRHPQGELSTGTVLLNIDDLLSRRGAGVRA